MDELFQWALKDLFQTIERNHQQPVLNDIPMSISIDLPDRFDEIGIRDMGLGIFAIYRDGATLMVNAVDIRNKTDHLKNILSQILA